MARAILPIRVVHVRTPHPPRIVQLGVHGFNPGQIVALSNSGADATVVHTKRMDFVVEMPLHEAVHLLNGEDPRDFLTEEV